MLDAAIWKDAKLEKMLYPSLRLQGNSQSSFPGKDFGLGGILLAWVWKTLDFLPQLKWLSWSRNGSSGEQVEVLFVLESPGPQYTSAL